MKYEEYAKNGSKRQRTAAEIESDAAQIRAEMNETLNRLEEKLSSRALVDTVLERAKLVGDGSTDIVKSLGNAVRENPVPMILIGAGITALFIQDRRQSHGARSAGEGDLYQETWGEERKEGGGVRERAGEMKHRVQEKAGAMKHRIAERGTHVRERVRERAHDVREFGTRTFQEQPLVVIGVGLALGAMLGALIPVSEKEHRTVGRMRDRVVDKTKQAAMTGVQRAREAVSERSEQTEPNIGMGGAGTGISGQLASDTEPTSHVPSTSQPATTSPSPDWPIEEPTTIEGPKEPHDPFEPQH